MYKESRNVLKLELNLKTVSFKALLLQMMNLSSRGKSRVSQSKLEESVPESGSAMAQSSVLVSFWLFFPSCMVKCGQMECLLHFLARATVSYHQL